MLLPARRTFMGLAAASVLVAVAPVVGFGADAALLICLAVDAALLFSRRGPEIDVECPARLGQGEEDRLTVRVRNRSARTLELRLGADIAPALAAAGSHEVLTLRVEPRSEASVAWDLLARRRGRHGVPAVHLRLLGPLGLCFRQWRRRLDREVEVVPGLKEVRSYRLLGLRHHLQEIGLRNVRQRGEGGAFESLREYVRGDDPRHLDWKASARHRTYIVRQYEVERSQSIVLCLDTGRLMMEEARGVERLDHALAAALVLHEVARAWNDHVGVFAFSDRIQAVLPPARYPPDRIASLFAGLESRPVEPDYPRALTRLSRICSRRSLLVFFGDVIDEEVSAPLASQLARLARRHLPLFVALREESLFATAFAPVADRAAAYRRAAATELVLARARTLAKMREHGIRVADVPPGGAVAAAVNRYIEIKRRGEI